MYFLTFNCRARRCLVLNLKSLIKTNNKLKRKTCANTNKTMTKKSIFLCFIFYFVNTFSFVHFFFDIFTHEHNGYACFILFSPLFHETITDKERQKRASKQPRFICRRQDTKEKRYVRWDVISLSLFLFPLSLSLSLSIPLSLSFSPLLFRSFQSFDEGPLVDASALPPSLSTLTLPPSLPHSDVGARKKKEERRQRCAVLRNCPINSSTK